MNEGGEQTVLCWSAGHLVLIKILETNKKLREGRRNVLSTNHVEPSNKVEQRVPTNIQTNLKRQRVKRASRHIGKDRSILLHLAESERHKHSEANWRKLSPSN